jgi:predicted DCC family thiol-disulfide oxidoreductase YuxK
LVIRNDQKQQFVFAAQQSAVAQTLLKQYANASNHYNSVLLIDNGQLYTQSTAALRIIRRLSGLWPCLYIGILLPTGIRNRIYQFVARNRYRWFGKRQSCIVPNPKSQHLFIDQ